MPEIFRIGHVIRTKEQIIVNVDREYRKALWKLESFSHIHAVCMTKNAELTILSGKYHFQEGQNGIMVLDVENKLIRIKESDFPLSLIDIKPYMPSEDYISAEVTGTKSTSIFGKICKERTSYLMEYAGEIRNTYGTAYLQYKDSSDMPKEFSEFVRVIWWFHRFEDSIRRMPYEDEAETKPRDTKDCQQTAITWGQGMEQSLPLHS